MCLICIDLAKQVLTPLEARRNLGEMVLDPGHREEVARLIEEIESRE